MRIFKFSIYFLFLLAFVRNSYGTHIRAGEITATQIGALEYYFTFTGYRDVDGVLFGNEIFDFGDGTTYGGPDGERIPWERPRKCWKWGGKVQFTLEKEYAAGAPFL